MGGGAGPGLHEHTFRDIILYMVLKRRIKAMFIGVMILVSTLGGGVAKAADHLFEDPGKASGIFYVMPSQAILNKCREKGYQYDTYYRLDLRSSGLAEALNHNLAYICFRHKLTGGCAFGEVSDQIMSSTHMKNEIAMGGDSYPEVCYKNWNSLAEEVEAEAGLTSGEVTTGGKTIGEGGYTVTVEDSGPPPSYCELNPNATSCQCERGGGVWTPTSLIKNTEEGLCSTAEGGINDTLQIVISIMTVLIGLIAAIGIVVVGVQYLSARDNPARLTKAKQRFLNMGVGLAIYAMMAAIVGFLMPGGYQFVPSEVVMEEVDEEEESEEEVGEADPTMDVCPNTYDPKVTYNSPYEKYAGTAGPMYGNIVIVSLFVDDAVTAWNGAIEPGVHAALGQAVNYLQRQVARYGHSSCVYWDWESSEYDGKDLMQIVGKKFNDAITSRSHTTSVYELESVARNLINVKELTNKYHADSILAIYFVNTQGGDTQVAANYASRAYLTDGDYFETVVISVHNDEYSVVPPMVLAHEISHTFGALDLYLSTNSNGSSYIAEDFGKLCDAGFVVDLMCATWSTKPILSGLKDIYFSDMDAYLTGLTDSSARINKYNELYGAGDWANSDHVGRAPTYAH